MTAAELWVDEGTDVAEIDGEIVHAAVTVDLDVDSVVTVRRVEASSDRRQGLALDADTPMTINGIAKQRLVLWADSSPEEVVVEADAGRLTMWNVWETDGAVHAWVGAAGIVLDTDDDEITRLRASDGMGEFGVDLEVEITIAAR